MASPPSSLSEIDNEENKFEAEIEGETDWFQLNEILWLITHESNPDGIVKDVLLLTHRTFTTSMELMAHVEKRFFDNEKCTTIVIRKN